MNARTPDRQNSRLTLELPTLSTFENYDNWVKGCEVSELPTHTGTPDPQGIWKLVVGLWPSILDMFGINIGHVRYDQDSELSKSVKHEPSELPTIAGTLDRRNFRLTSELWQTNSRSTILSLLGKYWTCSVSIPDCQTSKKQLALLSLKQSKLTWVGLSTYETLSINMMYPS